MQITNHIKVPTGDILVVTGEHGPLECLSLGDYGRNHNVKADFLGLTKDIGEVVHTKLLPLEEKWVITISTQYGCSMGCTFCDVPMVGPGRNATVTDLISQVVAAQSIHPEVTKGRINLHYARMGEPTFNMDVLDATNALRARLKDFHFHPVISTMMPKNNKKLSEFLFSWLLFKNTTRNDAGLQLSINSTDDAERCAMFNGNSLSLCDIARMVDRNISATGLRGRKIALNFAVADFAIDAKVLKSLFDPNFFMVKLTPMHQTRAAKSNCLATAGDCATLAPYRRHEEELKAEGFDVLVFVASKEEDESRITCGNAILSSMRKE
jgi:23S rRNA (adenine2503-C2)-methyltransferase